MRRATLLALAVALAGCHIHLLEQPVAQDVTAERKAWEANITNEVNDHERRLQGLEAKPAGTGPAAVKVEE